MSCDVEIIADNDITGEALLLERAKNGDVQGVESLLKKGIRVDVDSNFSRRSSQKFRTPLHWAAAIGNLDICLILVQYGADVNACDMYDITPVHLAAEAGHADCLQLLVENEGSVNQATLCKLPQWGITKAYPYRGSTTPLHLASRNNHLDCMRVLFDAGADYNAVDEDGRTSLYMAAERALESAVLFHLENSYGRTLLSIPLKDTDETPLHHCVKHSLVTAIRQLLIYGSDVNSLTTNTGLSPLHMALQTATIPKSVEVIHTLITYGHGIDLNQPDYHGYSPLECVCFIGSRLGRIPDLAALFIMYGAKFMHLKFKKRTSLLEQELQQSVTDYVILNVIVMSLAQLPQPHKLCASDTNVMLGNRITFSTPDFSNYVAKWRWYATFAASVRSLQHHCRVTIRNQMGPCRLNLMHKLPLPVALQDYLLFRCDPRK